MAWMIALCIIGSALLCGLGFLLLLRNAFSRQHQSTDFSELILWPGLKVARGNVVGVLGISWLVWSLIGIAIVFLIRQA